MKFIPFFGLVILTAACTDSGTPTGGYMRPDTMRPGAEVPYYNQVAQQNQNVTFMLVTNTAQANRYIDNKLSGYTGDKTDLNQVDVANLAMQIASGAEFNDTNTVLLNQAMYVIDPTLFSACTGSDAVKTCVSDWLSENTQVARTALGNLQRYADVLDISQANFATLSSENVSLKFSVNESTGEINSISVGDDTYARINTSNQFSNGTDTLTYESAAGPTSGLRYSDFGYYNISNSDSVGPDILFAGGYDTQKFNESDIQSRMTGENMTFYGSAIGTVSKDTESENISADKVSLVFNKGDGSSLLSLPFKDWYTVTVSKQLNSTDATINFSEPVVGSDLVNRFTPETLTGASGTMNVGYYGPNPDTGIPTEATGLVQYQESNGINMGVAFGVSANR